MRAEERGVTPNTLELIGRTPLVALDRVHAGPGRIVAKAELVQPGGSVKDRAALWAIRRARESGALRPGQPVVEMTSGNMGAALAVVCAVLGHPFVAVMSAGNSPERSKMMRGLGADVRLVPQVDGAPGRVTGSDIEAATREARRVERELGAYYVDQFNNPAAVAAHEESTGPEIWEALRGQLDAFVACVGTGGTLVGTARALKRRSPSVLCGAVEPAGAEVLAGRPVTKPQHILQGTGYALVPPQWDASVVDLFLSVTDEEAESMRQRLGAEAGLFVGYSSAANVRAAQKLLESGMLPPTATVATVLADTGLKY